MKMRSAPGSIVAGFFRAIRFRAQSGSHFDLYHRQWEQQPLREDEFVDLDRRETRIQARHRLHPTFRRNQPHESRAGI